MGGQAVRLVMIGGADRNRVMSASNGRVRMRSDGRIGTLRQRPLVGTCAMLAERDPIGILVCFPISVVRFYRLRLMEAPTPALVASK